MPSNSTVLEVSFQGKDNLSKTIKQLREELKQLTSEANKGLTVKSSDSGLNVILDEMKQIAEESKLVTDSLKMIGEQGVNISGFDKIAETLKQVQDSSKLAGESLSQIGANTGALAGVSEQAQQASEMLKLLGSSAEMSASELMNADNAILNSVGSMRELGASGQQIADTLITAGVSASELASALDGTIGAEQTAAAGAKELSTGLESISVGAEQSIAATAELASTIEGTVSAEQMAASGAKELSASLESTVGASKEAEAGLRGMSMGVTSMVEMIPQLAIFGAVFGFVDQIKETTGSIIDLKTHLTTVFSDVPGGAKIAADSYNQVEASAKHYGTSIASLAPLVRNLTNIMKTSAEESGKPFTLTASQVGKTSDAVGKMNLYFQSLGRSATSVTKDISDVYELFNAGGANVASATTVLKNAGLGAFTAEIKEAAKGGDIDKFNAKINDIFGRITNFDALLQNNPFMAWNIFWNQMVINVSKSVEGVIRSLAPFMLALGAFTNSGIGQQVMTTLAQVAIAFGVLWGSIQVFKGLGKMVDLIRTTIGGLAKFNPKTNVMEGGSGLIGGFTNMFRKLTVMIESSNIGAKLSSAFSGIFDKINIGGGGAITSSIKGLFSNIKNAIITAGSGLKNIISNIFSTMWDAVKDITPQGIVNSIRSSFNTIRDVITTSISNVRTAISNFSLRDSLSNIFDGIKSSVSSAVSTITGSLSSLAGSVKSGLQTVYTNIIAAGGLIKSGFISLAEGIVSAGGAIKTAIVNLVTGAVSAGGGLKTAMVSIFSGLADSIRGLSFSDIKNTITGLFTGLWSAVKDVSLSDVKDKIVGVFSGIKSAVSGVNFSGVTSAITSMFSGIKSAVSGVNFSGVTSSITTMLSGIKSAISNVSFSGLKDSLSGIFSGVGVQSKGLANLAMALGLIPPAASGATMGIQAFTVALITNPVFILIASLIALGAALYLIKGKSDEVMGGMGRLKDGLSTFSSTASEMGDSFDGVKDQMTHLLVQFQTGKISADQYKESVEKIKNVNVNLKDATQQVKDFNLALTEKHESFKSDWFNQAKAGIKGFLGVIPDFTSSLETLYKGASPELVNNLGTQAQTAIDRLNDVIISDKVDKKTQKAMTDKLNAIFNDPQAKNPEWLAARIKEWEAEISQAEIKAKPKTDVEWVAGTIMDYGKWLHKQIDPSLKNFATQVTAGVKWIAGQIMNFPAWLLGIVMKTLTDFTVKVIAGVKWVAGQIMDFLTWLYNIIFGGESPHIDLSTVVNILEWVAGSIVSFSEWLLGIILAIPLDIIGIIVNIGSWIAGSIVDLGTWLIGIITNPSIIKDAIFNLGSWVQGAIVNLSSWLTGILGTPSIIKNVLVSISSWLRGAWQDLGQWISNTVGNIRIDKIVTVAVSWVVNAAKTAAQAIADVVGLKSTAPALFSDDMVPQTLDAGVNMLSAAPTPLGKKIGPDSYIPGLNQLLSGDITRTMTIEVDFSATNAAASISTIQTELNTLKDPIDLNIVAPELPTLDALTEPVQISVPDQVVTVKSEASVTPVNVEVSITADENATNMQDIDINQLTKDLSKEISTQVNTSLNKTLDSRQTIAQISRNLTSLTR